MRHLRVSKLAFVVILQLTALFPVIRRAEARNMLSSYEQILQIGRGPILASAWSPDGKVFAVSSGKQGIWIYDKQMRDVAHITAVGGRSLVWSPDGAYIATSAIRREEQHYDSSIYIWRVATGKLHRTLRIPDSTPIITIAWSPDGKRLAGAERNRLHLWESDKWQLLDTLPSVSSPQSLAWTPDSTMIAVSGSGTLQIWRASDLKSVFQATFPGYILNSTWSPDGRKLALGTGYHAISMNDERNSLRILDARNGTSLSVIQAGLVDSLAWSPDGKMLATGGNNLRVWDTDTGELLTEQGDHKQFIHTVTWNSDSHTLLTAADDNTLRLWELDYGRLLKDWHTIGGIPVPGIIRSNRLLQGHTGTINAISWHPDGKLLATASNDGGTRVWDSSTGQSSLTLVGHGRPVYDVAWSPDGSRIADGSDDNTISIWKSGEQRQPCNFHAAFGHVSPGEGGRGGVRMIRWSSDGKLIASGGWDGFVRVWEVERSCSEMLQAVQVSRGWPVAALSWNSSNSQLFISAMDRFLRRWNQATNQVHNIVDCGKDCRIFSTALSPDGRHIVGMMSRGEAGGGAMIWDANTFERKAMLDIPCADNAQFAWSPNSEKIAGICGTGIAIWNAHSGKVLAQITTSATALAWNPDNMRIASAGIDGVIRIWRST
jgi:WD40 repeat protein